MHAFQPTTATKLNRWNFFFEDSFKWMTLKCEFTFLHLFHFNYLLFYQSYFAIHFDFEYSTYFLGWWHCIAFLTFLQSIPATKGKRKLSHLNNYYLCFVHKLPTWQMFIQPKWKRGVHLFLLVSEWGYIKIKTGMLWSVMWVSFQIVTTIMMIIMSTELVGMPCV